MIIKVSETLTLNQIVYPLRHSYYSSVHKIIYFMHNRGKHPLPSTNSQSEKNEQKAQGREDAEETVIFLGTPVLLPNNLEVKQPSTDLGGGGRKENKRVGGKHFGYLCQKMIYFFCVGYWGRQPVKKVGRQIVYSVTISNCNIQ